MSKEEKLNIKGQNDTAMGIKKVKVRIMCNDFLRTIIKYECRGFAILLLLLFVSLNVSGQAVLLDKTTGQRISYAQILNSKGAVIGTTDIDGKLPQDLNDEVVTIQGEFYQFNLSSCIRQQNSLTAQFVSFSLSNLANIFYPPQFLQ